MSEKLLQTNWSFLQNMSQKGKSHCKSFSTPQQQPSEAFAGIRSLLLMLTPSQSLLSVWGLFPPLGRCWGPPQSHLCTTENKSYCFGKQNLSASLGTGISGSKESWQIYGECRIFLQCCIPGKPSSTWFDSNNNSFTESPSVNRVGWTTFSCFCFKTSCASSAMTAVSKLKCLFLWVFSHVVFLQEQKSTWQVCWALFLSLFYLCNQCQ